MLRVWSFFTIFCFFLDNCLGGWSQWMWLVSSRRQGMLTQGPIPDPKCELNITFLTLTHPLHCLICAKNIMVTVLLLQVMGECQGWGWFIYVRVSVGGQGVGLMLFLFFILFLCCCWLFFHGWYMVVCCVCFIVPFLLSLFLVPLIRCY